MAAMTITWPPGGASSNVISTSAPLARSASMACRGIAAETEARAQEGKLGAEMGKTPDSRGPRGGYLGSLATYPQDRCARSGRVRQGRLSESARGEVASGCCDETTMHTLTDSSVRG